MNKIQQRAAYLLAQKRTRTQWAVGGGALALCLALLILYRLISPASTLEGPVCGYEAHTHTALCYDPASYDEAGALFPDAQPDCGLTEHLHGEDCYPAQEEEASLPAAVVEDTTPLDLNLSDYAPVVSGTLSYWDQASGSWVTITGEETEPIPGDAELRLLVKIDQLSVDDVKNAGNTAVYTLPQELRHLSYQTGSTENCDVTLDAQTRQVKLVFHDSLLTGDNATLTGYFAINGNFDLTELSQCSDPTLTVGSAQIKLNLGADPVAQYGEVSLEKSVAPQLVYQDGLPYAQYTLTVTAGEDGLSNLKVTDTLSLAENKGTSLQLAESILIPDAYPGSVAVTQPTDTAEGGLTWTLSSLAPGESATLTYLVALKDDYVGIHTSETLTNSAALYTQVSGEDVLRDEATTHLPLSGKATLKKTSSTYTPNESGLGGTLTYTIVVEADKDNPCTLKDLVICDYLADENNKPLSASPSAALTLVDFRLYEGQVTEDADTAPLDTHTPTVADDLSFTYSIGALEPGEKKTLVYTVSVPDAFVLEGNDSVTLRNRAQLYDGDNQTATGLYNSFTATAVTLDRYQWTDKTTGKRQEAGGTISLTGDACYVQADSRWITQTGADSFSYQPGSYLYEVWINRDRGFDVSGAVIQDLLGSGLSYTGYLQVDAVGENETVVQTVWLSIDGQQSFSFTPEEVGFSSGSYAYHLTYYASSHGLDYNKTISVGNTISLSGTVVGTDKVEYALGQVSTSVTTAVTGGASYVAEKSGWYFASADELDDAAWPNGALYWVIAVSGTELPEGLALRDVPGTDNPLQQGSLVGVYQGQLDLDSHDLDGLSPLSQDSYSVSQTSTALTVTFLQTIPLGEQNTVYVVVRTAPKSLPGKNAISTFSNRLETKTTGEFVTAGSDSLTVYGSKGVSKTAKGIFTVVDGVVTDSSNDRAKNIDASGLENGTYLEWLVDVNWLGTLSGDVTIIDNLPQGTELGYVRYYAKGSTSNASNGTLALSSAEGWTHLTHTPRTSSQPTIDYYYNKSQNEVRWLVTNLETSSVKNDKTAEYQVVARVTDEEVLLGGVEKELVNTVSGQSDNPNNCLGSDSAGLSVQTSTLTKTGGTAPSSATEYPFTLTVNPLGEDLIAGSDTIKLVDEMSDTLKLCYNSIQVVNSNTGAAISNWSAELSDSNVLTLTLPDDQPLTITYTATVVGIPGSQVTISNSAHWWGYSPTQDSVVPEQTVSCAIVTSFDANSHPMLSITKADARDLTHHLSGATFQLCEVLRFDGTLPILSPVVQTGTTDADGFLSLGYANGQYLLSFNTIYQLVETAAPEGYVREESPIYFVIAQADKAGNYPDLSLPDGVAVTVSYQSSTYELLVNNEPRSYALPESGGSGSDLLPALGAALCLATVVGLGEPPFGEKRSILKRK